MKSFQFRLASALRLREVQLQAEQSKLHQLIAEQQRLKNSLEALQNERREQLLLLQNAPELGATELRALSSFLVACDTRALNIRDAATRQERLIEEQRRLVLRAERNVKLLDKLRERKLQEWTLETNRQIEAAAQEAWLAAHHAKPGPPKAPDQTRELEQIDRR
jgi:flagellar export protein FliJ